MKNFEEYLKEFREYHKNLFDVDKFLEWVKKPIRKSIRVNTLKISPEKLFERLKWNYEKIPWSENGFFVDEKCKLGSTIEHDLGYYYVQEAASMIPVEVLDVKDGDLVLDLCAAPGSKTTQIACKNLHGTIVANEFYIQRAKSLTANVARMGITNCIITNKDGCKFYEIKNAKEIFDKVLVDAPCSAVGTARKNPEVLKKWSLKFLNKISSLQKKLLISGFECLKKGGILVYSTCTTTIEENEEVVKFLLEKYDNAKIEKINIRANYEKGKFQEIRDAIRIYPWHNDTESMFIAKIKKE